MGLLIDTDLLIDLEQLGNRPMTVGGVSRKSGKRHRSRAMKANDRKPSTSRFPGTELDFGFTWEHPDGSGGHRVSWHENTGRLYVILPGGGVEVLAVIEDARLVRALMRSRPRSEWRVEWLRALVERAPTEPTDIAAFIAADERHRHEAEARLRQERRESFRVVDLGHLPEPEPPYRSGDYATADWPAIAALAVELLSSGVDPLDEAAISEIAGVRLPERDAEWLYSLFVWPIVVDRDLSGYIDGQHRT